MISFISELLVQECNTMFLALLTIICLYFQSVFSKKMQALFLFAFTSLLVSQSQCKLSDVCQRINKLKYPGKYFSFFKKKVKINIKRLRTRIRTHTNTELRKNEEKVLRSYFQNFLFPYLWLAISRMIAGFETVEVLLSNLANTFGLDKV